MTPGDFEVENVVQTPDRPRRDFSIRTRRYGPAAPVARSAGAARPTRMTSGQGIEWMPVILDDGQHNRPAALGRPVAGAAALMELSGAMRDPAPGSMPKDFPAAQLV